MTARLVGGVVVAVSVVAAVTVLAALGKVDGQAAVGIFSAVVGGGIFSAGHVLARGAPPE